MRGRKPKIVGDVEKQALELHAAGKNDKEVGAELGVGPVTVASWRNRLGLSSNRGLSKRLDAAEHDERVKLVLAGKSDPEIAAARGTTSAAINIWRKKNKIIGNYGRGGSKLTDEAKRMQGYKFGLPDAEIAKQTGTNRNTIRKWRKRNGLAVVQAAAEAAEQA